MYGDVLSPGIVRSCVRCVLLHLPDKLAAMRTEGGLTQKRGHELVPIHLLVE